MSTPLHGYICICFVFFKRKFIYLISQVVASLLPHSTVKPALFWQVTKHIDQIDKCILDMNKVTNGKDSTALFQFLLQSYSAGFNYANRNSSSEQVMCLDQAYRFIYELIV